VKKPSFIAGGARPQKVLRSGNGDGSGAATPPHRAGDFAIAGNSPGQSGQQGAQVVTVWQEDLVLPTYLPAAPDKHPMFLEKRVYQGSSGRVYPLPFTDRIAEKPVDRKWQAVWMENEFIRVLVLPEIGGRIHAIQDRTNGYDLIYNQHVIKPALVGLAGPWISGGIEFNWPQHHRPATFLPVDFTVEAAADGSKTLWCSDHDPMARMKGMHGVCLHPGRAVVELKVRAYNRTPLVQTFLWWANVATRVHEGYQSFFPPDVFYVADHARRSMSEYPLAKGFYYGVNYGERGRSGVPEGERPTQFVPPHCRAQTEAPGSKPGIPAYAPNDLAFYANIPTPCSYMCMGSREDFFGGYDYLAQAGIIHVANHHISPGKKQWTWGNHAFGYAWDRNLTEKDAKGEYGPYIEIMAGVYTDNQPDFSFLQPGETKTWSQFWYPIQKIGPAQHANGQAAVALRLSGGRQAGAKVRVGVAVTRRFRSAQVSVFGRGQALLNRDCDLGPGEPFLEEVALRARMKETELSLRVSDADGREIISYAPDSRVRGVVPPPATEPPAPADIASADELYLTGLHLEQYRHATRSPVPYWQEALRRDPGDARCNNALGLWHLRRGEFVQAETLFRKAIARLTRRNANPYDGEPFYNLGLCLRYQADRNPPGSSLTREAFGVRRIPPLSACESAGMPRTPKASRINPPLMNPGCQAPSQLLEAAYDAFYKATWNQAWQSAAYHALAELDCRRAAWGTALEHLDRSLRFNTDHTRARDLRALVLRRLGREKEAEGLLRETLALDPLDWWARHLVGQPVESDLQVCLDLAHDYARAGLYAEAIALLERAIATPSDLPDQSWGAAPLVHYTLGWLHEKSGDLKAAHASFRRAASEASDYCFPARLEEIAILEAAMRANPRDARAPYYLGNLLYDRRRHEEAIRLWERSARIDPSFSVVWRNLGIGCFNIRRQPAKARAAYERAFRADPASARVLFERDQLWKRLGTEPAKRLRELENHADLVRERDDLSVELCSLYNQIGRHAEALKLVGSRNFQPWEGGEGGALGQHVRSHLALGREALGGGDAETARCHFAAALEAPENLGEAKHLLANQSDIHYWLGIALAALGQKDKARQHWQAAATFRGDFQEMSVRAFSEMTYYSARAWERLGQKARAKRLLRQLLAYAQSLQKAEARIEYFATSLPTMLLFEDDLQARQETTALFLQAQALLGLGKKARARALLRTVLKRDPNHALAADLLVADTREG
jgi:tetratricopeptide (TPR) repeat protein